MNTAYGPALSPHITLTTNNNMFSLRPLSQARLFSSGPSAIMKLYSGYTITPATSSDLLLITWIRHHLFMLGLDKVKLYAYQKLSSLSTFACGGTLKQTVGALASYIKSELPHNELLPQNDAFPLSPGDRPADFRSFYISIGYMMFQEGESDVRKLTEDIVDSFLKKRGPLVFSSYEPTENHQVVMKYASDYYKSVPINYRVLYDPRIRTRKFTVEGRSISLELPPLPKINSRRLLARALLHKELYRAFTDEAHPIYKQLAGKKCPADSNNLQAIRYDLLFLDGLGDFFIATEASAFLYKFKSLHPYSCDASFGKKTYTLLKTILGTNSLLLKLAVAYNLHHGLDDPIVKKLLFDTYIPSISKQSIVCSDPESFPRYEQEFIADYFEQYVGALYLEQPEMAREWLFSLFSTILFLISDTYRVNFKRNQTTSYHYNYRAWSVDVIGRSI